MPYPMNGIVMRLRAILVMGLMLLSLPSPALWGGASGGANGRAASFNHWNQSGYADFFGGGASDVAILNRTGGGIALRSISVHSPAFPGVNITAMCAGPGDFAFAGTSKGEILRIDSVTGEIFGCGPAIPGEQCVTALARGADGSVWGGTAPSGKLFRIDPQYFTISSLGVAVSGEARITALAVAPDGKIWGGTSPGCRLFRIDPATSAMTPFGQAVGGEAAVTALAAVLGGKLWGGTSPTGQVFEFDTATGGYTPKGRITSGATSVRAMLSSSRLELWATTAEGGSGGKLVLLNLSASPFQEWSAVPVPGETTVNCIAEDGLGMLWGGTGGHSRLFRFDPAARAVVRAWDILAGETNLTSICTASSGAIWGGTEGSPKFVSVSPELIPRVHSTTLSRPRSGRMFFDDFEVAQNGKPAEWTEQNGIGGAWTALQEQGRGNVYAQMDSSAQNTFSIAGDQNWTDCYFDTLLKVTDWVSVDPGGNGARIGARSDMVGNKYAVTALDPQDRVELWRLGSAATRVASYPADVAGGLWTWSRVHIAGQTAEIWFNGSRLTPGLGLATSGTLARGAIALGAVRAGVRFDNVSVFRDVTVIFNNLSVGQKVMLMDGSGNELAEQAALGTTVSLDVSALHFPLTGYFNITANDGKTVIYTSELMPDIWGGDLFTVNLTSPSKVYLPEGVYTSAPFDAGYGAPWSNISWQAEVPAGTSLSFRIRTAATQAGLEMAAWSVSMKESGSPVPSGPSEWIQYQARLCTTAEQSTPLLGSVSISYEVLEPNMTLNVILSPPEALPGEEVDIGISFKNVGQGLASEVAVDCALPADLQLVNSSAESRRLNFTWTFGNLSPGQEANFTVTARVDEGQKDGDVIELLAGVTARDSAGATLEKRNASAVLLIWAPSISITLSSQLPYVVPGGLLNITAELKNAGGAGAWNVTLEIEPPFSWNLTDWSGPMNRTGDLVWSCGSLDANGSLAAIFSFGIAALPLGLELKTNAMVNYQDATGKQRGPCTGSCIVPVGSGRPDVAQLNVTGSSGPDRVLPGSHQSVRFFILNNGTNISKHGEMSVFLSDGVDFSGSGPRNYTYDDLKPGANLTLDISVTVNRSAEDGQNLFVSVEINYTGADGNDMGHANASVRMTVSAPRMSVVKEALDGGPAPGSEVTFRIEFRNDGSAADPAVRLVERPPVGMSFVCATTAPQDGLGWNFSDFRPGMNAFFVIFRLDEGLPVGANLTNDILFNDTYGHNLTASANITIAPPVILDMTPPAVIMLSPENGRKDVSTSADIEVLFSERMNRSSAEGAISISPNIPARFLWEGDKMILRHAQPLAGGTHYTVKVRTSAMDLAGNGLPANVTFSFTTKGTGMDLTGVAFALAIAMMAIAAGETVYLISVRRKSKGGKEKEPPVQQPASPEKPQYPVEPANPAAQPSREPAAVWEPEPSPAPSVAKGEPPAVLGMDAPPPRAAPPGISLMQPPAAPKKAEAKPPQNDENIDDILTRAMDALK